MPINLRVLQKEGHFWTNRTIINYSWANQQSGVGQFQISFAIVFWKILPNLGHAAGGAVGWGTALQTGTSRVRFLMVSSKFFIDVILPGHTMALRLTQPLTEMSTSNISLGGKGGRCVGLTTLQPSCADCPEIWEPQVPGTLRVCPGL